VKLLGPFIMKNRDGGSGSLLCDLEDIGVTYVQVILVYYKM
jgi:hypothetical protein